MIGKRKRNKYFQQAINEVKEFTYLDYHDLDKCYDKLKGYSEHYQEETHDQIIIVGCVIHGEIQKIPYINRFSDKYTERLNEELADIKRYANKFKHGLFITFTVDPKRFSNPKQMYKEVQAKWNNIMTVLRKKYGIKYYIKTVEFTSSHIPHIHVMLFHSDYIPIEWLRKLWNEKYNIGTMVRIEYVHTKYVISNNNTNYAIYPLNYILKYILKAYETDQSGLSKNTITKVWQWSLQARAYSVSHALVSLIFNDKTNSNSEYRNPMCSWHYLGSFNPIEADEWVSVDDVERHLRQLYGN